MGIKKYNQKPNIKVSETVKNKLDKIGNKGNTYEEIINMLVDFFLKRRMKGGNNNEKE